ncbi:AbrB family transcriptional regulator [Amycolatopsis sp. NBC_01480]
MLCYVLAEFAESISVPAAQLLVAILVGVALALTGRIRHPLPARMVRPSHAVVGALMGSYLQVGALGSLATAVAPLLVVTVASVAACYGVAYTLARLTTIPLPDSALGMTPGGSAAIVACAADVGADARFVAFTQYVRVGMVALTAPFVVLLAQPSFAGGTAVVAGFPAPGHLVDASGEVAGLLVLAAVCLLGAQLGRRLALPAPVLLGSMLVAAVAGASGGVNGFTPAGPLRDVVFVVVGLEVGLKFTRSSMRHIGKRLPLVLGSTVLVCAICAGLAALLPVTTGMPFLEAYLATTPGGINAVLATADSARVDVPVVSAVQSVRLFLVCLVVPLLARRMKAPFRRRAAVAGGV